MWFSAVINWKREESGLLLHSLIQDTREVTIAMWFHVLLVIVAIDLCEQGKIKIATD